MQKNRGINFKRIFVVMLSVLLFSSVCYVAGVSGGKVIAEETRHTASSVDLFDGIGWKMLDVEIYGAYNPDSTVTVKDDTGLVYKEATAVEEYLYNPFNSGAFVLWYWFNSWDIDISIDGLIYGRMSTTYDGMADFTHFGMEKNNPYGIAGSIVYFNLRSVLLAFIPIVLLCLFIRRLINNGARERAQLKDAIQGAAIAILLMFALPYLLNLFFYFRDAVMWVVSTLTNEMYEAMGLVGGYSEEDAINNANIHKVTSGVLSGGMSLGSSILTAGFDMDNFSFGRSIVMKLMEMSMSNPTFLNTVLFVAAVGASVFFFGYYVTTAGLLAMLFGLFPLVAVFSVFNRKILSDWLNMFLPNLLVPFIDMILIQLPSVVYAVYCAVFSDKGKPIFGDDGSMILCILLLILIFAVTKFRAQALKLFGFAGIPGGNMGMAGVALMAMRMFASFGGKSSGSRGDAPVAPSGDSEAAAGVMMERDRIMQNADRGIKALPELSTDNYGGSYEPYFSQTDRMLEDMDAKYNLDISAVAQEAVSADAVRTMAVADADTSGVMMAQDMGSFGNDSVLSEYLEEAPAIDVPPSMQAVNDVGMGVSAVDSIRDDFSGSSELITEVPAEMTSMSNVPLGGLSDVSAVTSETALGQEPVHVVDMKDDISPLTDMPGSANFRMKEPMPVLDEKFCKDPFISERNVKRYENLAKLDACNERIKEGEVFIKNAGYDPATYRDNMARYQANISQLDTKIQQAEGYKSRIQNVESVEYKNIQRDIATMQQTKQINVEKMQQLRQSVDVSRQNDMLRRRVSERMDIERQYAANSALGGMSDRRYQSAEEFKYQMQIDSIKKKQADYKNFDSKQYEGILSPQEKVAFYQTRMLREREARVQDMYKKVAAVAVGSAASVSAAAFAAYGGPVSMAGAAMLGAQAGSRIGAGVISGTGGGDEPLVPYVVKTGRVQREVVKSESVTVPVSNEDKLYQIGQQMSVSADRQAAKELKRKE